jgi:exodeoxyribonuclease VII small subunit
MAKYSKKKFNDNYQRLKDIAEQLDTQQEPDIDKLIPLVEQATEAYKICQERIIGVQKILDEKFQGNTNDPE